MAISSTDIQYRLSGGASNSSPAASLGGAKSSNAADATIFDTVNGVEQAAGDVEYRCIYVHNAHASLTLYGAYLWLGAVGQGVAFALGLGTAALNGAEQSVADENTAPSSVTFAAAASQGAALALGDIPAGQGRSVWVRRTVTAGAPATPVNTPNALTFHAGGDTAA